MKKLFAILLSLTLSLSLLTACGGGGDSEPAPSSAPASSSSADAGGDVSAEQQAAIDDYAQMVDEYNAVIEELNQYEDLVNVAEVANTVNAVTEMLDGITGVVNAGTALDADQLAQLQEVTDNGRTFTAELAAMAANYGGQTVVTIAMQLGNDTGADLYGVAMSPSNEESWGANLLVEPLMNGDAGEASMTITAETLVWDIMAMDAEGNTLEFYGLDFSEVDVNTGAQILLTTNEAGEYVAQFVA